MRTSSSRSHCCVCSGLCVKDFLSYTTICCDCGACAHTECLKISSFAAVQNGIDRFNRRRGNQPLKTIIDRESMIPVTKRFQIKANIVDLLKIQYGSFNKLIPVECTSCHKNIYVFTKENIVINKIRHIYDVLKDLSEYIDFSILGLGIFSMVNMFNVFVFASRLDIKQEYIQKIIDYDNGKQQFNWSMIKFLVELFLLPHFMFTLTSASIDTSHLVLATGYSSLGIIVNLFNSSTLLQKLIKFKLLADLIYKLTINRYFYEKIKQIPIYLFPETMSFEDMIVVQQYRNDLGVDAYCEFDEGIMEKIRHHLKTTWNCLNFDFSLLFNNAGLDDYYSTYEGLIIQICSNVVLLINYEYGIYINPYLSPSHNYAVVSIFGMIIPQCFMKLLRIVNSFMFIDGVKDIYKQ